LRCNEWFGTQYRTPPQALQRGTFGAGR